MLILRRTISCPTRARGLARHSAIVFTLRKAASRAPVVSRKMAWLTRRSGEISTACTEKDKKTSRSASYFAKVSCTTMQAKWNGNKNWVGKWPRLAAHDAGGANAGCVLARTGVDDGIHQNLETKF